MVKLFSEIPCLQGERVTLRRLEPSDADALRGMTESERVYKYLPTFLFEKKYEDKREVIERLYDECLESSLILGIFTDDGFCGLGEIYSYTPALRKASVGYRLTEKSWGKGIATESLDLLVRYLFEQTDVRIITASTQVENSGSANVLKKNGFKRVLHGIWEDWGFPEHTVVDKWLKTAAGYRHEYRFR